VYRERQSPYAVAFLLLLFGAIPQLAWTADDGFSADFVKPTPSAEAFGPAMSKSAVFFPAVAGLLALFLAWSMRRWLRGLGFVAIGAGLLGFVIDRAGAAVAFNGQFPFDALTRWDLVLVGGFALAFVAARAQADWCPGWLLSLLAAAGGAAVLAFLVVPRAVSAADVWLGLVSKDHADTIPIARGFLRNQEFAEGTHAIRYVWWNLYLVALVLFPLLCLRIATRLREGRPGTADRAYGALVFVLFTLAMAPVAIATFGDKLNPNTTEGETIAWQTLVVSAANSARLLFPPLLLAVLALVGVSDFFKELSWIRLPQFGRLGRVRLPRLSLWRRSASQAPPAIPQPPAIGNPNRPARIRMTMDAYGAPERL
jgi:hypothetical protein